MLLRGIGLAAAIRLAADIVLLRQFARAEIAQAEDSLLELVDAGLERWLSSVHENQRTVSLSGCQ
jgi:hypothetical protein